MRRIAFYLTGFVRNRGPILGDLAQQESKLNRKLQIAMKCAGPLRPCKWIESSILCMSSFATEMLKVPSQLLKYYVDTISATNHTTKMSRAFRSASRVSWAIQYLPRECQVRRPCTTIPIPLQTTAVFPAPILVTLPRFDNQKKSSRPANMLFQRRL